MQLSFEIEKDAGFHLLETPLAADQRVTELPDGWLQVSATVVDSAMLQWWLRGFGEAVRRVRKISPINHTKESK